jgi:hypothetical protein
MELTILLLARGVYSSLNSHSEIPGRNGLKLVGSLLCKRVSELFLGAMNCSGRHSE